MYKVLIVDDEPIAVESIEFIIRKNFDTVKLIEKARSGKDAIEKTYQYHPDIIIMDINMPGINGLEAMKQIRKVNPIVSIIVITAFDYFDYAIESVALRVEEYLLKPVKEAKFVEAFRKVMERIEQNDLKRKQILEQQERLEMILPILENGFMNSLCMYGQDTAQLQNYCDLFGYFHTGGYVMAIEFGHKSSRVDNKIGAGIHGEKMYAEYKSIIKATFNCMISPILLNRIIVYVFDEGEEGDYEQKAGAVKAAGKVIERALRFNPDILIGIGSYHKDIKGAKKSYRDALHALRFLTLNDGVNDTPHSRILHGDDIFEKIETQINDYEQLTETQIFAKVLEDDDKTVLMSYEQLFERMCSEGNVSFDTLKKWLIGLIVGFEKRWEKLMDHDYYKVLIGITNTEDQDALYLIGSNYINEALLKIAAGRQSKASSIIEKADQYINEHYQKNISLDDVARYVNLSSYYFSRFYKNTTGTSFSDKVVLARIEKAKELLKRADLSIKDVSYMVGYADPNYFSKTFKKLTGYNASEYKKRYGL